MRSLRGSRTGCGIRRARVGSRSVGGGAPAHERCAARPRKARPVEEAELIIPSWQHRVAYDKGVCTVTLSGELDMAADEELADLLAGAAGRDGVATVQVDLAYVTFLDCCTITVLLGAHEAARAAGRRLVVQGPSRSIRRVLEVTGAWAILGRG